MATANKSNTKKKTQAKSAAVKPEIKEVETDFVDEIKEEVFERAPIVKKTKMFENTDLIPCLCAFPGTVVMTGKRSGNTYLWQGMGVVENVEYQDLRSEVLNKKSSYIYKPLIIIDDQDFLEQNEALAALYDSFYTPNEIMLKINKLEAEDMKNFIISLPTGIRDGVKNIAATMIQDGTLDSLKKIKALDDIFETELRTYSQFFVNEE